MSLKNRIRSFAYAFNGLRLMLFHQPNFFIHLSLAIIALSLSYFFKLSRDEFLWIVVAIGLVLSAEIFNTAIEKLTDLVQPEQDQRAGQIKDLAAGAVLLLSITALIIGLLIFIPHIFMYWIER
jgi:diacylglycerol kinase